jgi:glycosyltransferase involved in cell wall biosynthesis
MSKEKGIIDLIHAIPLAVEQESDLKFMIVGAGPLTDWVRDQCNRLRTERGITITWMEWIDLPDKIDYYNGLKLFVLPTYNDAFPTTILEAMACGTPVLATPVGAIPDVIADEDTGFFLESNAPESIAQRITMIVNYKGLEKVSDNAESLVRQKFARTAATERYDMMLKKVLAQRDHF